MNTHRQHDQSSVVSPTSGNWSDHASGSPPFIGEPSYIVSRLHELLGRLSNAIYPERKELQVEVAGPVDRIPYEEAVNLDYRPAKLGEPLGPTFSTYWFRLVIKAPEQWQGNRVDLAWSSNSEALLWIDGETIQGFNPGRDTAKLIETAVGDEELTVFIEVACNHLLGADGVPGLPWPAVTHRPSHWLQTCELRRFDPLAWDLFHDFRVLTELVTDRVPMQESRAIGNGTNALVRPALDSAWAGRLLYDLNAVCNLLDLANRDTWNEAQEKLRDLLSVSNGGVCHQLSAIGHAHIDTAWLWPLAETYRKTLRTFSSAIRNMDDYPEFRFACSQAYQYECIERQNPSLFKSICAKVEVEQWVPVGGSYIEPDCNLPSGESLCRQFLYGQRYFESRFGKRCNEFWNPDVFGYAGQLPQIMRLAGVDHFLTQKLSWNRFTTPPHHTFYWESPDGSRVLTHFPPADTYNGTCEVEELRYHAANYKDSDRGCDAYYLFGHGDGGGGPTTEMLETLRRTSDLLGVPRSKQRTPEHFFKRLKNNTRSIPTILGELYLEAHRATYTSQAMMKRGLRKSERLLHDIEFIGVLSHGQAGSIYPKERIDQLWKKLLLNQFHDILPGSSIAEVHEQARADFAMIREYGQAIREELLEQLAPIDGQPTELLPLNTTSFSRREVADVPGKGLAVTSAPANGFGWHLEDDATLEPVSAELRDGQLTLQNSLVSAVLSESGDLMELVDLESGISILGAPGNTLVLYDDRPSLWDAWDVEPSILETGQACEPAKSCRIRSHGPLRAEIEFHRSIGSHSDMTQTIRLDALSRRLEFHCEVNWHEEHKLLRVMFPTKVQADRATFEMPFGFAERPTHCNTTADAAKFEVPGHRWADLSEPGYGLALITACKYGYIAQRGTLGLSLLRAPTYPDTKCDIGKHQFSYAVLPHKGGWREGAVVAEATTFNQPLLWAERPTADQGKREFVVDGELVLDTIKLAEDGNAVIARLYDPYAKQGEVTLKTQLPVTSAFSSNILEDEVERLEVDTERDDENQTWNCIRVEYRPAEIVCLRLNL